MGTDVAPSFRELALPTALLSLKQTIRATPRSSFFEKEMHLLAQLARGRGLYAECKGADLDAVQELGLLQWFDAHSSTTPFKQIRVHY